MHTNFVSEFLFLGQKKSARCTTLHPVEYSTNQAVEPTLLPSHTILWPDIAFCNSVDNFLKNTHVMKCENRYCAAVWGGGEVM